MPTEAELASGLTAERVRELLDYDPTTGVFRWRGKRSGTRTDKIAGCVAGGARQLKRRAIKIDGRIFLGYRLAWLCMTGEWPSGEIDHVDRNSLNDAWSNLRHASRQANMTNVIYRAGALPRGVRRYNRSERFAAYVSLNGRRKFLGSFLTPEEAHRAYADALRLMHGGDFLPKAP